MGPQNDVQHIVTDYSHWMIMRLIIDDMLPIVSLPSIERTKETILKYTGDALYILSG